MEIQHHTGLDLSNLAAARTSDRLFRVNILKTRRRPDRSEHIVIIVCNRLPVLTSSSQRPGISEQYESIHSFFSSFDVYATVKISFFYIFNYFLIKLFPLLGFVNFVNFLIDKFQIEGIYLVARLFIELRN